MEAVQIGYAKDSSFKVIPGKPCNICGGPTFLATYGPGRPAVRVCDSVTFVAYLRKALKGVREEVAKVQRPLDDAVAYAKEFELMVAENGSETKLDSNLRKALGINTQDVTAEQIVAAIEKARESIVQTIQERTAKVAAEMVPELEQEAERLRNQLATSNEFCQAVHGWRDDRLVRPPTQAIA